MTKWTEAEDEIIRKRRADRVTVPKIAAELGRPVPATYARARKLETRVMDRKEWTMPEVKRLEALYREGLTIDRIAEILGRPVNSVRWKLDDGAVTLDRVKVWTAAEDAVLAELAAGKTARQVDLRTVVVALAARVGTERTVTAVEGRIRALDLFEAARTVWTDEEVEVLKGALDDLAGFAATHGKELAAVERKVRALGLSAPNEGGIKVEEGVIAAAAARKGGLAELADRLGVPLRSLRAHGQKVGAITKRDSRVMTDEKRQRILDAAAGGMTVTQAMKALGHDVRVLKKVAAEAGVTFAVAAPKVRTVRPKVPRVRPVRSIVAPDRPKAVTVRRATEPVSRTAIDRTPVVRKARPEVVTAAERFAAWRERRSEREALV